eukprot:TRINITY_DN2284_c0_g2_i1.p1 TRINITY_DN2284_c0_g2~~TRINITY_DN2284_c0_g2_i1.p1  ORF type:complete len:220 (-),score=44.88 TRINITY_DN2284_c0_g2_i1:78-737(-)
MNAALPKTIRRTQTQGRRQVAQHTQMVGAPSEMAPLPERPPEMRGMSLSDLLAFRDKNFTWLDTKEFSSYAKRKQRKTMYDVVPERIKKATLTLLLLVALPGAVADLSSEGEVLMELYDSTDGPHWVNNSGWRSGDDPCQGWYGVHCSGGAATQLSLGRNSLSGTLPSQLCELTGLQYLCLLYTSDAADEEDSVDLGGRRIIKKKKKVEIKYRTDSCNL